MARKNNSERTKIKYMDRS